MKLINEITIVYVTTQVINVHKIIVFISNKMRQTEAEATGIKSVLRRNTSVIRNICINNIHNIELLVTGKKQLWKASLLQHHQLQLLSILFSTISETRDPTRNVISQVYFITFFQFFFLITLLVFTVLLPLHGEQMFSFLSS